MGVRAGYDLRLAVDPVEGGSANAYSYCSADSVNCLDLSGLEDGPSTVLSTWRPVTG